MSTDTTATGPAGPWSDQRGANTETGVRTGAEAHTRTERLKAEFRTMAEVAWLEELGSPAPRTVAPEAERTLDKLLGFEVQA
jgi:hypothetical protein